MPTATRPLVSILIPCHNAERWIARAVESALAQTGVPIEVIVIDDGSTDGSARSLQTYSARISLSLQKNCGAQCTRNALLRAARGEWVQYLDADDELLPGKIAAQLEVLNGTPNADVILGGVIVRERTPRHRRTYRMPAPVGDYWKALIAFRMPQTGGPLMRRAALERVGGWREELASMHEPHLYFDLLRAGVRFATHTGPPRAIYRVWSPHTVCHRDPGATKQLRVSLLAEIESHLRANGAWSRRLRDSAATMRLEVARSRWPHEPEWSEELAAQVRADCPSLVPQGRAFPRAYQFAYRYLGFRAAERLAAAKRRVVGLFQ